MYVNRKQKKSVKFLIMLSGWTKRGFPSFNNAQILLRIMMQIKVDIQTLSDGETISRSTTKSFSKFRLMSLMTILFI